METTKRHAFIFLLIISEILPAIAFATPPNTALKTLHAKALPINPLASTVLLVPTGEIDDDVVFLQKSMNERIQGLEKLKKASQRWDVDFQSDLGVNASIVRVSTISKNLVNVKWNVTWVPPTALWLEGIGKLLDSNVETVYVSYNHLAQTQSAFSWTAVFKLFEEAFLNGKLRVPLACIEGNTEFLYSDDSSRVVRITEDLSYAEDLRRRVLQNRKCSQDLMLFLETGRRMADNPQEWDDKVAVALPWHSVAGSGSLDVDPVEEGPMAAVMFIGLAVFSVVAFAAVMAPELIGQPLFGPPNYIVQPQDLNSLY